MKSQMTLAERQTARQRLRDEAIARADRTGRTIVCQDGAAQNRPDLHARCRGEEPSCSGCLCECHDPEEADLPDLEESAATGSSDLRARLTTDPAEPTRLHKCLVALEANGAELLARGEHLAAESERQERLLDEMAQDVDRLERQRRERTDELAQALARAEHAEAAAVEIRERADQWKRDRDAAWKERDNLRARITGIAIHAKRLDSRVAPGSDAWSILADLFAVLEAPSTPRGGE